MTVHQLLIDFKKAYDSIKKDEFHDVRQLVTHTAESLLPERILAKVEIAIGNFNVINPKVLIRFWPN
jgi:hypothetical protein